ncbi:hypothetical protein GCM10010343_35060 [Streptomyces avidinii]|nr:hypothetical protein GCM10010343_35060 [Streptomyces avidinii]
MSVPGYRRPARAARQPVDSEADRTPALAPAEQKQPVTAGREAERVRDRQGTDTEYPAGPHFDERVAGPVGGLDGGAGDVDRVDARDMVVGLWWAQGARMVPPVVTSAVTERDSWPA